MAWMVGGPWTRFGGSATRGLALAVVVDASALVELLLATTRAPAVAQAVAGSDMLAPDLVNAEVLSVLRRLELAGHLRPERGNRAMLDLRRAPVRRVLSVPLLAAAWALRANVSAYDGLYVALAQALDCSLVTGDLRLARTPGLGVPVVAV